ncbi:MAG: hypothetical protein COA78_36790 [Blastopirellula sp.]|nr:MAG: hypothetical protein COA78_36790 [Blastopirellula sp.]
MSGSSSTTRADQTTTNTSLSQGIQGDNSGVVLSGNGNTVQMTDMGAIDGALSVAASMADGALGVASGAIDANYMIVDKSLDYANEMAANNAQLADGVIDSSVEMLGMSLDANGQALNTSALLMDSALGRVSVLISNQQEVNNGSLMAGYELSTNVVNSGNELALALTEQIQGAMVEQSQNTFDSLNNGFKSMMQFADNASRSDGATVAQSSNKVLMVGLIAAAVAVAIRSRK